MTGRGLVAVERGRVVERSVPVPERRDDEILLRTEASWISNGTELSFVKGERHGGDTPWRPGHPDPFPHVPGYQKVGIVEEAARDRSGPAMGTRVFATVSRVEGLALTHAGHLEISAVHVSQTIELPEDADPLTFAPLVLAQVGRNAAHRADVGNGGRAIVIGDGLVGQWAARTLATDGIETAVLGRRKDRLARLPSSVVPFDDPALAAEWFEGGDLVVQTAGRTDALAPFVPRIRRRGAIVSAAFDPEGAWLDVQTLRDRELSVAAVSGWSRERLIETRDEIAAGRLSTLDLITDEVTPNAAPGMYDRLLAGDRDVLGVAIRWA